MAHVHKACLRKWVAKRGSSCGSRRCEVCQGQLHHLPAGLVVQRSAAAAARLTGRGAAVVGLFSVGLPVLAVVICGGVIVTGISETAVWTLDATNPGWWQRRKERRQLQQEVAATAAAAQLRTERLAQAARVQEWRMRRLHQQRQAMEQPLHVQFLAGHPA